MRKILAIYGPTATGKTDLGITLAKKFNGEIISADSRQIYSGLDIGTGKVNFKSKVEKHKGYWIVDQVKINGFDLAEPGDNFSVADFLEFANDTMIRITGTNKLPIFVGGTGFYIKALIDGIDSIGIPQDLKLRRQLENLSTDQLYQKLTKLNPDRAKSTNESDRKNPRRLIRAIEIAMTTSHSGVATTTIESRSCRSVSLRSRMTNYLIFGLTAPNDYLYYRADQWLQTRLERGLVEEVQKLLDQKIDPNWLENLGLEYRWVTRYLLGKIGKSEMVERLKGDVHSFIRRQKTWFRKFNSMELFDISQPSWTKRLENKVHLCYISHSLQAFA